MKSADSQTIVRSSTTSPRMVPDRSRRAGRQLDHGEGAPGRPDPPRLDCRRRLEDAGRPGSRKSRSRGNRMKAVWTLEQGARTRASPAARPRRPRRPCRREPESNAAITGSRWRSPGADVPQPEPPLRLANERGEAVGHRSERHADAGAEAHRAAVAGRRLELPRLGRGDQHPLLVAVGRRHQVHVLDGARLRRRRTPGSRSAPRARPAAGCSGRCGRMRTAGVTWGSPTWKTRPDGAARGAGPHAARSATGTTRPSRSATTTSTVRARRRRRRRDWRRARRATARPVGVRIGAAALPGVRTDAGWRSARGGCARSGRRAAGRTPATRRRRRGHRRAGDRQIVVVRPRRAARCRRRPIEPRRGAVGDRQERDQADRRRDDQPAGSAARASDPSRCGACRGRRACRARWQSRSGAGGALRRRAASARSSASSAAARRARSSAGSARSATAASTSRRPGSLEERQLGDEVGDGLDPGRAAAAIGRVAPRPAAAAPPDRASGRGAGEDERDAGRGRPIDVARAGDAQIARRQQRDVGRPRTGRRLRLGQQRGERGAGRDGFVPVQGDRGRAQIVQRQHRWAPPGEARSRRETRQAGAGGSVECTTARARAAKAGIDPAVNRAT